MVKIDINQYKKKNSIFILDKARGEKIQKKKKLHCFSVLFFFYHKVADILGKATESVPKEEVKDNNPHLKNLYEGLTMTEAQLLKVKKCYLYSTIFKSTVK